MRVQRIANRIEDLQLKANNRQIARTLGVGSKTIEAAKMLEPRSMSGGSAVAKARPIGANQEGD